jgi:hypothetical protein
MSSKQTLQESLRPDTPLHEELRAVPDDDVVEMTNLAETDTGIKGIVFISTTMSAHGPRVKYFLKAGGNQPSFSVSIGAEPRVLASSLPDHVLRRIAPQVIAWVRLNREALLTFWNEGTSWTHDEVNAFVARLQKLPHN